MRPELINDMINYLAWGLENTYEISQTDEPRVVINYLLAEFKQDRPTQEEMNDAMSSMRLKTMEMNEMKITKRQLKRIIREEVEQCEYELSSDTTDMMLDEEYPEDVETQEDSWAGGQNIHQQLDHSEAGGGDPQNRGVEVLRISESGLRYAIRHVIIESEQQKLLGLGHTYSAMELLQKAKELVGSIADISNTPEGSALATAIRNKMTKDQIQRGTQLWGDFNMILGILDPDRGRKQSYRRGIEDEMRELDPTGSEQRSGRMVRSGNRVVRRDW